MRVRRSPIALFALAVAVAACSESTIQPSAELDVSPYFEIEGFPNIVALCKVGPAGTNATFTIEAAGGTFPAGQTVTVAASDVPDPAACVEVWKSVEPRPEPDAPIAVTVTEVAMSAGTALDRIIVLSSLDGSFELDGTTTNAVTVNVNYDNGATVFFKNIEAPDMGGEGCTPGYWRQEHHYDSWTGVSPSDLYSDVFGVGPAITLGEAVQLGGGDVNALIRHSVAALLNANSPDTDYFYSAAEIISLVQAAFASGDFEGQKNEFDELNNTGCELN